MNMKKHIIESLKKHGYHTVKFESGYIYANTVKNGPIVRIGHHLTWKDLLK